MADAGVALEARVQRLFLAQGIFAERSLLPTADAGHRLLATDIDVLVSEYASGFHLTRRHAECKSGRRVPVLDRILWLSGVRAMLGADASYLVLDSFDEGAADFARSLNVDVMTVKQLEIWEQAFKVPADHWPNRSDFKLVDPVRRRAMDLGKQNGALERDKVVRQALQFVEIDSWRVFGYGRLNRLLAILRALSDVPDEPALEGERSVSARYSASALLVRLSQYLLAVCHDVSRVPVSDIHTYLLNRLKFGDQDPRRARALVQGTVDWISLALRDRGMAIPPEVDSDRLFQPPTYSEALVSLTQKLLGAPNEARYVPVAMETLQFGEQGETALFLRLNSAWLSGRDLAALVKGFAIASVGVDSALLAPLRENPAALWTAGQRDKTKDTGYSSGQAKLSFERP